MIEFVLGVCLTVAGGTATGGIVTVVEGVSLAMSGYEFGKSLTDNGDGTITIDAKFISDVILQYEKVASLNGFDDSYYKSAMNSINQFYYGTFSVQYSTSSIFATGRYYSEMPIVIYLHVSDASNNNHVPRILQFTSQNTYKSVSYFSTAGYQLHSNGTKKYYNYSNFGWIPSDSESGSFTCNCPVFEESNDAIRYIEHGDNASDALNYNPSGSKNRYRTSSSYNHSYNGGNVTFNKNKLPYVINKIDDLNNKYPDDNDTDKIINEFNIWLYSDEPEPETETPIEPDTSEVGNDLTETNGWLQKIYNRIGEFMNSFSSQKNKLNNLLESKFNELITAVKNIGKSDEPETEPETETETETETSTDKTDIIIENQEKSQGILESILTAIQDGFKDTVNELKKIRRWTALDTIFDGLDAVADWLDFVKKFFDNVTDGIGLLVSGFTDTVTELTKVFPFSIPITLVLIVKMFSAPPEAPKFELPLKLDAFNIDEKIVIDLSQFQVISVISRTFLTIIYCVGLYHLTFKIILAKKGG